MTAEALRDACGDSATQTGEALPSEGRLSPEFPFSLPSAEASVPPDTPPPGEEEPPSRNPGEGKAETEEPG